MTENKETTYWLCNETLYMKDQAIAFKQGKKYKQISIKNDNLVLENESGDQHNLSYDWRISFECIDNK